MIQVPICSNFPTAIFTTIHFGRNPDNDPEDIEDVIGIYGLWCFTTDPDVRAEPCDVPLCPSNILLLLQVLLIYLFISFYKRSNL